MYALASILCGLAAWAAPGYALLSGRNRVGAAAVSGGLCTFALYFQMIEYEGAVLRNDWAGLLDTCQGESMAATLLLAVALALNLWALLAPKFGGGRR